MITCAPNLARNMRTDNGLAASTPVFERAQYGFSQPADVTKYDPYAWWCAQHLFYRY